MQWMEMLYAKLRRETSSGSFIAEIDGLRFLAITMVILYHINGYLLAKATKAHFDTNAIALFLHHGRYGVEFFFVISGFVLALPFAKHYLQGARPVSLKSYFLRRILRLEPPYIIAMTLVFLLFCLVNRHQATTNVPHFLLSLLYLHSIVYGTLNVFNGVSWSLEVEVQFYTLTPLLARIFSVQNKTLRRVVLLLLCLAASVFQFYFIDEHNPLRLTILNSIQYFLLGYFLADLYLTEWKSAPQHESLWDGVALVVAAAFPFIWASRFGVKIVMPFAIILFYIAVFRSKITQKIFSHPLLTTIGGMCYSLYLLHYMLISFLGRITIKFAIFSSYLPNLLLQVVVMVPCILVVCSLFFAAIEKPCMRKDWPQQLRQWLESKRQGVA